MIRRKFPLAKIILVCSSLFIISCLFSIPASLGSTSTPAIPQNASTNTFLPSYTFFSNQQKVAAITPQQESTVQTKTIAPISTDAYTLTKTIISTIIPGKTLTSTYIFSTSTLSPNIVNNPTATSSPNHSSCVIHGAYPDQSCTPGASFYVTSAQVCVSGYSSSVRSVSDSEKAQVYAEYGITSHTTDQYEIDHFISLELGGSNDISNLWPEPASPVPGYHEKDRVENYLHEQVCSGAMTLAQAQYLEIKDWVAVYYSMGTTLNTPVPTSPQLLPTHTQPSQPLPTQPPSGHPSGTTGLCNDGSYTSAQHKQGACSHHGGINQWWGP